ncbi:MAG: radical SAM protein [ANME-2 cluster archaeon]|nr:radical SAM protein [ANME-2 cluster archaeon]MBC2706961.1 radical SAM protein [ANME-2 cluster archaeon]
MRVYDKSYIKLNANTENGKVQLVPEGTLSPVAKPIVNRINKIFLEEKPISVDDKKIIFSSWAPPIPSTAFDRLISAQIASVLKRRVPDQSSIGITMRCPNKCIHCGAADIIADPELSLDEVNRVIDESIELGSYLISFDGGEPMLRHDLADMVRHVDKSRAIATSFSSGYGLTPEKAKELKAAGLYAVRISIDSPRQEEHERVRGRAGSYEDAMKGIDNTLAAGILADMFVVVSPDNIDELEDFYTLAENKGMHEMSLYEIIAVGRWLDHEDETIGPNDVDRLGRFQKEKNKLRDGPRITAFPFFMGPDMFGCFAGRRWVHITSGGDVLPCAYTPLKFGNIRDEPLKDIWKRMGKNYRKTPPSCLMRDKEFRNRYIHSIPKGATMPFDMVDK